MTALFNWLTKWFAYVWCGTTLLAYASVHCNPAQFGYFSLLGLAIPWLLLGCFLLVFIKRKTWRVLLPIGCLVMGWGHFRNFVGLCFSSIEPPKTAVRVVTWNLGELWDWHEKPERITSIQADFFNFLQKKAQPDVFCIQEMGGDFAQQIAQKTGLTYFCNVKGKGTSILSRFPIEQTGEIVFEKTGNSCIWADVKLSETRVVRVICAHFQSDKVSPDADRLAEKGSIKEKKTWYDIRFMLGKVNWATQKRVGQARQVADFIQKSPHAVILCGDFNDTPHSFIYQMLTEHLTDPFAENHPFGFGTTYRGSIPGLRIDFALTDPRLRVFDYQTLHPELADHFPVALSFSF